MFCYSNICVVCTSYKYFCILYICGTKDASVPKAKTQIENLLGQYFLQDVDVDARYKNYSTHTRRSLEAWSGSQLDLGLVCSLIIQISNA